MGSASSIPADFEREAHGITVMMIVLTTVATVSRMVSRSLQRAKTGTDDYLVGLAYLANLALLITILLEASKGAFSLPKIKKVSKSDQQYLTNVTTALGFLYSFAILFVKMSILFMYRRIFPLKEKWFQLGWWANFILLMPCYTATTLTLTILQVSNGEKFGANDISKYGSYAIGSMNAISDVLVLILPVAMVSQMMLPFKEKLGVIGIFSLGTVATSISIMRVVRFHNKREEKWNLAYSHYNDYITTSAETSVALICVCLTVVKPLLKKTKDLAIHSAANMTRLLSLGSGQNGSRREKTSASSSGWSDKVDLHSRERKEEIAGVQHYNVASEVLRPVSSQRDMEEGNIRP